MMTNARSVFVALSGSAFAIGLALVTSNARAEDPLPPLPPSGDVVASAEPAPADPAPAPAEATPPTPAPTAAPGVVDTLERVRRGIVVLERSGHVVGFGTVLEGDGRILTALSALGPNESAVARFPDGSVTKTHLTARDRAWDLALVAPEPVAYKEGLRASTADPKTTLLRAPFPAHAGAKPLALPVKVGGAGALARDGSKLADALAIDVNRNAPLAGVPLLDAKGDVVAIVMHACKSESTANDGAKANVHAPIACAPMLAGAPVTAIRDFLGRAARSSAAAWLGIAGESYEASGVTGVRLRAIAPSSPAQGAGLHAGESGDVIVAVDGVPVDAPDKLAAALSKHAPGDTVKLLVYGVRSEGADPTLAEIPVELRASP